MAEQLTRLTGRIKQANDAEFFLVKIEDIDAAEVMNIDSAFPVSSLKQYLLFTNLDTTSELYDLYVDVNNIVINTSAASDNKTAKLGAAILGTMVLGSQ